MIYEWECPDCHVVREVVSSIARRNRRQYCEGGHDRTAMQRIITAPPIGIADIKPYQAVAGDKVGEYITSRREHREFLKRNRLIEVGDSKPADTRQMRRIPMTADRRAELRRDIRDSLRAKVPRHILEKRG